MKQTTFEVQKPCIEVLYVKRLSMCRSAGSVLPQPDYQDFQGDLSEENSRPSDKRLETAEDLE